MGDIHWEKLSEKKKKQMTAKIENIARNVNQIDFTKPARTGLVTKFKFYAVRMMQTGLGKDDPEYADYKYWNANGWIGTERPWK